MNDTPESSSNDQSSDSSTPESSENLQPEIYVADDTFPEVQPPNSKFLIQLFVVPFLIVLGSILLVMIPIWLSNATEGQPEDYLEELEHTNHATWQAAWNLAESMHNEKNKAIKSDPVFANKLVGLLRRQLDDKNQTSDDKAVRLRCFLCRSIGTLHIDTGLQILIETAGPERELEELEMRLFALEALAELTDTLGAETLQDNEALYEVLRQASLERSDAADEKKLRDQLRVRAAFTLGVLGGERGLDRLNTLTSDNFSDVRYNAANGLARHGDERAIPVLLEMLEPQIVQGTENNSVDFQKMHSAIVTSNALRAITILKRENPAAELAGISAAIENLLKQNIHNQVRSDAMKVQELLVAKPAE
ncbi:MAG: HEAT repeat domain-containing protein [Pirellulales bacterium]